MRTYSLSTRKYRQLLRRLNGSDVALAGIVTRLFLLTRSEAYRGDLGAHVSDEQIADWCDWHTVAGWLGLDPSPATLIEILVSSGWLHRHPTHRLVVDDWSFEAGRSLTANVRRWHGQFADEELAEARGQLPKADLPGDDPQGSVPSEDPQGSSRGEHPFPSPSPSRHVSNTSPSPSRPVTKRHDTERGEPANGDGLRSRSRDGVDGAHKPDSDDRPIVGRIPADPFPPGMTATESETDAGPDPEPVPRDGRTEALALLHVAGVNGANRDRLADVYADDPAAVEKVVRQVHADGRVKNPAGVIVHRLEKGRQLEPLQRQRRGGAAAAVADIAPDVTRGVMAARRRAGVQA